jgi:hypothetical protein
MEKFALDATHKGGLTITHYLDCSPNVVRVVSEFNKLALVVALSVVSVALVRSFQSTSPRA